MKNFNGHSSHDHHGSKRRKLAQHRTHVDRTHSLTQLHQHSYNHVCAKRQLSYYRIWNPMFILKEPPEEGGCGTVEPLETKVKTLR